MPANVAGYVALPLEIFGGIDTDMAPTDIPEGASPENQDVAFQIGLVKTRPGTQNVFAVLPANPTVNYLKTYITQTQLLRMMALDSLGNVYKENPIGTLQLIFTGIDAPYGQSASLFTREYLAFSDGQFGVDVPRQYDDTNFDRVSQVGPGAGPTVADFLPLPATIGTPGGGTSFGILSTVAVDPQNIVYFDSGGKPHLLAVDTSVLVTTITPHGFAVGSNVILAGNTLVNGTFTIASVPTPVSFKFVYQTSPQGQSGTGGTASEGPPATNTVQRIGNTVTVYTTVPHQFQAGFTVSLSGLTPAPATLAAISSITRQGGVVTVNTVAAHGLVPNAKVMIASVAGDTTFNGTFVVASVAAPTQFTYAQILADSTTATPSTGTVATVFNGTFQILTVPTPNSFTYQDIGPNAVSTSSGQATVEGNVAPGIHQVAVSFITRQGYITKPSPPTTFTSGGGKLLSVTNIPIGPSNIVGRVLMFTPVIAPPGPPTTLGSFVTIQPAMQINDNTTTAQIIDFSDAVLFAPGGQNQDHLFNQLELGESAGVVTYSQRLFWWGERNKVPNFVNLTFDGGWSLGTGVGGADVPLGWTSDPVNGLGSIRAQDGGVWLDGLQIGGEGISNIRGMVTQSAFQDYLAQPIIQAAIAYSIRARVKIINPGTITNSMFLNIDLFSPSTGTLGTFQVPLGGIGTTFQEFIQAVMPKQASIPSDLLLRVYASGTLPAGPTGLVVDDIEVFPTLAPFNTSLVRASGSENPERYDGLTGFMQFGDDDGTRVTNGFQQRGNLYIVKERSLWQTQADSANEPSLWTINRQSATVGTPSIHGVGFGEDWVVIANRQGLYFFDGGEPEKISQEIQKSNGSQPGWDAINWQYGHTLWCVVDTKKRRIIVGVPIGNATTPNLAFVMDYRGLDTGLELKSDTSIHISAYTGKILDIANGRKWTRWNIVQNSGALIERPDGTAHIFMGNGAGTGKIYDLLEVEDFANPAQFSDDGVAINSYYDTYFFLRPEQEQLFQLDSHRKLFEYLSAYLEGQGIPAFSAFPPGNFPAIALPQSGNAAPPLVSSLAVFSVPITTIRRDQFANGDPTTVTVTTATPHGLTPTSVAVIQGVSDATFNGAFGNLNIGNSTTFSFQQNGAVALISGVNVGTLQLLTRDMELPINVLTERCKFRVGTNAVGSWFSLRNLTISVGRDPFAPVRGVN